MGVLGAWLFTEATGTTRYDSSGNGLDLTDDNANYPYDAVSDMADGSLYGSTYAATWSLYRPDVNLPATFPGKDGGSGDAYSFYIRFRAGGGGSGITRAILHKGQLTARALGFSSLVNKKNIKFVHWDGAGDHSVEVYLPDETNFHTVISRWNGAAGDYELSVWLNGIKDATTHTPTALGTGAWDFLIGNLQRDNVRSMGGWLDEAGVFDNALTEEEILFLGTRGIEQFLLQQSVAMSPAAMALTAERMTPYSPKVQGNIIDVPADPRVIEVKEGW